MVVLAVVLVLTLVMVLGMVQVMVLVMVMALALVLLLVMALVLVLVLVCVTRLSNVLQLMLLPLIPRREQERTRFCSAPRPASVSPVQSPSLTVDVGTRSESVRVLECACAPVRTVTIHRPGHSRRLTPSLT